ncbi:MAG: tRNA preQ1(34) S-adenosylmethionine ribosyltransferase-isomerase QueA [Chromatiales bacterium]|jgi:S-adenosylmethionine:tRNA ribosyltransferase-isomerase|nr:tRNA preQ1(34) S-adenosylmethionine ribosyltransferase-isomerase QueA [Chromatiales bacterium]
MRRSQFDYDLPQNLIAQQPLPGRGDGRLLVMSDSSGQIEDSTFRRLPDLLEPGDLLVLNDTRVIPARLFGRKPSGGRVEMLVERPEGERIALAHLRASKTPRPDTTILIDGGGEARVLGRQGDLFRLSFDSDLMATLDRCGHVPLPPYIGRDDAQSDRERYQTVYADRPGAVAAPTAGLHFDKTMLASLACKGIEQARITLHVGAGTFQPVRVDEVRDHRMHSEWLQVTEETCRMIAATHARGNRVVAVGTTVVRSLETAAASGDLSQFEGLSNLFIYPGYDFRVVDAMITNFHLPESTLLMLVCAFAGTEAVLGAYRHAIRQRYRFFSYGDAMFVTHNRQESRR